MEYELMVNVDQIKVKQGSIEFNEYAFVKKQAEKLAAHIGAVEVTENTIKESKKLLAAINKRLKELEDKRISIKRVMLEPYQEFEEQVKEIIEIVKDADAEVRNQVRYLEEFERLQKEEKIKDLFEKRKQQYMLGDLIEFEHFLQSKYLNKSITFTAIEKEMIDFLEKTANDFEVIQGMDQAKEILSAYIGKYDLAAAITHVQREKKRIEQIQASEAITKAEAAKVVSKVFSVTVFDEKDYKLLKLFMEQNNIKFKMKEVI